VVSHLDLLWRLSVTCISPLSKWSLPETGYRLYRWACPVTHSETSQSCLKQRMAEIVWAQLKDELSAFGACGIGRREFKDILWEQILNRSHCLKKFQLASRHSISCLLLRSEMPGHDWGFKTRRASRRTNCPWSNHGSNFAFATIALPWHIRLGRCAKASDIGWDWLTFTSNATTGPCV
jgi:hypothetical protein